MLKQITNKLAKIKANKVYEEIKPYLGNNVLDLGSGRGLISKKILDSGKKVTCIDVKDYHETKIPTIIYDGKKIPFKDKEFDTVIIIYVLHHINWQENQIKEIKRVCSGKVIIMEDSPVNIFTYIMDYLFNSLTGVRCVYKFHKITKWMDIFKNKGFKICKVKSGVEKEWFYPFVPHTMFVLETD